MAQISAQAQRLLRDLLEARRFDIPVAELTDREADAAVELEGHDFVQVLDPDGVPSITLGETAIKYADVRWCDHQLRWLKVRILPETDRAIAREFERGRVRTVYETDLNARRLSQGRSRVGMDGLIAQGVWADDLEELAPCPVGLDLRWDGPDCGNLVRPVRPCACCAERRLEPGEVCLKCDQSGEDGIAVARSA